MSQPRHLSGREAGGEYNSVFVYRSEEEQRFGDPEICGLRDHRDHGIRHDLQKLLES